MANFLKMGDTVVNLDQVEQIDLHFDTEIDAGYHTDGVRLTFTQGPTTEWGDRARIYRGEEANLLRRYFERPTAVVNPRPA